MIIQPLKSFISEGVPDERVRKAAMDVEVKASNPSSLLVVRLQRLP
jgi:hypothetical protein